MTRAVTNNKLPYAVVIGLDGINGLQTARILDRHEVPVIGIAKDRDHFGCKTNSCKQMIFVDTESDELIETLTKIGPEFEQKAVLVPCEDLSVLLISRQRERLQSWYHILLPPNETVEMLINKYAFYSFAQKEKYPIPTTMFLLSREDAEQAAKQLKFPCVLKPAMSVTPAWSPHSRFKAYRVPSPEVLLKMYDKLAPYTEVLIIQEWIEGPDENLYSCNCYFDKESNPQVTFVARKLRQWPPDTGISSLGEECHADNVRDETLRLFKRVRHYGLGYLEMKRDSRSGEYFIVEPNIGRPTGRSSLAEAAGVELIYTMYCDATGLALPPNRQQHYRGTKWIYLRHDLQSAVFYWRRGQLTFKGWLKSMSGRKADAVFSWNDLGPFLWDFFRSVRKFLQLKRGQHESLGLYD